MNIELVERLFLWLIVYSMIGWLYETTLCSVRERKFINRGFLNGPYCPIYGCGALLDILVLGRVSNPILLFVLGMLLTCSLEYLTSFLMEKLFHARWWDYSKSRFNLNGRVCLLGAVVFGAFSVVLIMFIHPLVVYLTSLISITAMHIISSIAFVGFAVDNIITFVGFADFNTKLCEFNAHFEQRKAELSELLGEYRNEAAERFREKPVYSAVSNIIGNAYESFNKKLSYQQRRMLNAFPMLRSVKYNSILVELREHFKKIKSDRKTRK